MNPRERIKRPVPAQIEPERSWNGLFPRDTRSEPERTPGSTNRVASAAASDTPDAAYDAVNRAYRIADEYMRQGQRVAEQAWLPYLRSAPVEDAGRLFERFVRSAGEMGTAWLEILSQWTTTFEPAHTPRGAAPPFAAAGDPSVQPAARETAAAARAEGIAVSVESTRKVQVAVDLHGSTEAGALVIRELAAMDPMLPPLKDIHVDVDPQGRRVVVRLRVPTEQPSGVYNGLLVESGSQRAAGTVSVLVE